MKIASNIRQKSDRKNFSENYQQNNRLTTVVATGVAALSFLAAFESVNLPVKAATMFHLNADYANISQVTAQGFELVLVNDLDIISIDENTIRTVPGLNRPDAFPPNIQQPSVNLSNATARDNNTDRVILDYEGTVGEVVTPNQYIHILADGCFESGRAKVERTNFTIGTSTPISPELAMPGWFAFSENPTSSCNSSGDISVSEAENEAENLFTIFRLNILDDSDQVVAHVFLEFEGTDEATFFNDLETESLRFTVQTQMVNEFIPTEALTVELEGFSAPSSIIELIPDEQIEVQASSIPESSYVLGLLWLGTLGSGSILKQKLKSKKEDQNVGKH